MRPNAFDFRKGKIRTHKGTAREAGDRRETTEGTAGPRPEASGEPGLSALALGPPASRAEGTGAVASAPSVWGCQSGGPGPPRPRPRRPPLGCVCWASARPLRGRLGTQGFFFPALRSPGRPWGPPRAPPGCELAARGGHKRRQPGGSWVAPRWPWPWGRPVSSSDGPRGGGRRARPGRPETRPGSLGPLPPPKPACGLPSGRPSPPAAPRRRPPLRARKAAFVLRSQRVRAARWRGF